MCRFFGELQSVSFSFGRHGLNCEQEEWVIGVRTECSLFESHGAREKKNKSDMESRVHLHQQKYKNLGIKRRAITTREMKKKCAEKSREWDRNDFRMKNKKSTSFIKVRIFLYGICGCDGGIAIKTSAPNVRNTEKRTRCEWKKKSNNSAKLLIREK